jgi:pimeloyl-ACP methyl ester carboxylesterase
VQPETRYAKAGDIHIAYQVFGDGPIDMVLATEFWHSIEVQWDQPDLAAFLERLGSFARVISFDQRGSGISDPVALGELTSLDLWMDDIHAVMDEAGSESAVLYGIGGGGTMAMLYAASHPDRVSGLVLVNSFARLTRTDDYPWGRAPSSRKRSWTSCAPGGGKEFSST